MTACLQEILVLLDRVAWSRGLYAELYRRQVLAQEPAQAGVS
jgi:hypothetical protein